MSEYLDGFDHYTSLTETGWTGGSIVSSGARTGSQCLQISTSASRDLSSQQTSWVFGGAANPPTGYSTDGIIVEFQANTVPQIGAYQNSDGTVSVKRGGAAGTVLATSVQTITLGSYQYIEFKATINNATGSYDFQVNGTSWVSASGVDTDNSGFSYADDLAIGNLSSGSTNWDDIYILNGTSFWGKIEVQTLRVSGNGATIQWTPLSGSNFDNVDETLQDSNTTYVNIPEFTSTISVGYTDLYSFTNISSTNTVKGISVCLAAGYALGIFPDAQIAPVVNYLSSYYQGNTYTLTNSYFTNYLQYRQNYDTNPATASAWTVSQLNTDTEFGFKFLGTASGTTTTVRVSQIVVLVALVSGTTQNLSATISAGFDIRGLKSLTRNFSATISMGTDFQSTLSAKLLMGIISLDSNMMGALNANYNIPAQLNASFDFRATLSTQNFGKYGATIKSLRPKAYFSQISRPMAGFTDVSDKQAKATPYDAQISPPD